MNEREGGLTLPKSLNLNTVVLLAGMVAGFVGQWAIFNERLNNQAAQISLLFGRIDSADARVRELERDFDKARTQLDDVIEAARRHAANDLPPAFRKTSP